MLMRSGLLRQAIEPFERVRQLDPDNLDARLLLGRLYIASRLPDRALEALREPLNNPGKFSLTETNATPLNILAAGAYLQQNDTTDAVRLLQSEISLNPTNDELILAVAKAYTMHGLYTNALVIIDHQLELTPDDPTWLFSRGYISIKLKNYPDAISTMTRVLSLQTTNNNALFNRAIAYLENGELDKARSDYQSLQADFTNSPPVAYGLGEIAWRQHETNEAVRNYQIYLANANTNTAEATNIIERLRELKGPPH
jgi:tetratricopeptide (TPR) repeat protein